MPHYRKVVESRPSGHAGDLFRKILPPEQPTPVGTVIDLGEGELFVWHENDDGFPTGGIHIGLRPDDGRKTDWFDPNLLYRLHDQTLEIFIEPISDVVGNSADDPPTNGTIARVGIHGLGFGHYKTRSLVVGHLGENSTQ
jgi:hypothetical protein